MSKSTVIRYLGVIGFFLITSFHIGTNAQCSILPSAVPGVSLTYISTNLANCSGVAYNPNMNLYYAVRAGNPAFPLETWDAIGTPLFTNNAGFDYRGMWWNPNTGQVETNGYNTSGLWTANLDGSGYALTSGTSIYSGMNQPNSQSCGDYDPTTDEVIYYASGSIYRYSRPTGAYLGSYAITGLPVAISSINSTTVFYTGCSGMEVGVLDYVNKRVYMINKSTGAYSGMSQLPPTAVTTTSFRCSWANDLLWLFDLGTRTWYSFTVSSSALAVDFNGPDASWMNEKTALIEWSVSDASEISSFTIERSMDGVEFSPINEMKVSGISTNNFSALDKSIHSSGKVYYRIKLQTLDGEQTFSSIATIEANLEFSLSVFPNPATNIIQIMPTHLPEQESEIQLIDLSGKLVLQKIIPQSLWKNGSVSVDISDLPAGVYQLGYSDKSSGWIYEKIVKFSR